MVSKTIIVSSKKEVEVVAKDIRKLLQEDHLELDSKISWYHGRIGKQKALKMQIIILYRDEEGKGK